MVTDNTFTAFSHVEAVTPETNNNRDIGIPVQPVHTGTEVLQEYSDFSDNPGVDMAVLTVLVYTTILLEAFLILKQCFTENHDSQMPFPVPNKLKL